MSPVQPRILLAWSSGKDSAWALSVLRRSGPGTVVALLTTFNASRDRVAMHAVRRELVEAQAAAAGLPLIDVSLPYPCSNADYDAAMTAALAIARAQHGITHVAFGDLFLEDIRRYRESRMLGTGMLPLFPLWGLPTYELARDMIREGLEAHITCIDPVRLSPSFAGRHFDEHFLDDLPTDVDPCGEYGEFHTFACAGPMFAQPITVRAGEISTLEGFVFADLLAC